VLFTCFMLVSCVAYFSNLKMEKTCSFESSVYFQQTARRYIPEDKILAVLKCKAILVTGREGP
jgi:hypothetical protein